MSFFTRPTVMGQASITPLEKSRLSREREMKFIQDGEDTIRRQSSHPEESLRKQEIMELVRQRKKRSERVYKNQKEFDKLTKQMESALKSKKTKSVPSKSRKRTGKKNKSVGGTRKK